MFITKQLISLNCSQIKQIARGHTDVSESKTQEAKEFIYFSGYSLNDFKLNADYVNKFKSIRNVYRRIRLEQHDTSSESSDDDDEQHSFY